jgi:hypothetical protein
MTTRADCLRLDADDPLASLRDQFELPAGIIYLDGNSLGALPKAVPARLREVACDEWGHDLIRSWNTAGWMDLAQRVGDKIGRLVGAGPGELVVADGTSVNVLGSLAFGRRGAGCAYRGRCRFRGRLRLQILERRTGRARVHLGASATRGAHGSAQHRATAVRMAVARRTV